MKVERGFNGIGTCRLWVEQESLSTNTAPCWPRLLFAPIKYLKEQERGTGTWNKRKENKENGQKGGGGIYVRFIILDIYLECPSLDCRSSTSFPHLFPRSGRRT
jgi:hypothetical protein